MHCQMSNKAVTDGPVVHPGQSTRMLKCILPNSLPSGFLVFQRADSPRLRPDGLSFGPDGALFSFGQSVVLMRVLHCIYQKGSGDPRTCEFPKNLLLSGIIYGIQDSRIKIDMHLRNDQLGKLIRP